MIGKRARWYEDDDEEERTVMVRATRVRAVRAD